MQKASDNVKLSYSHPFLLLSCFSPGALYDETNASVPVKTGPFTWVIITAAIIHNLQK